MLNLTAGPASAYNIHELQDHVQELLLSLLAYASERLALRVLRVRRELGVRLDYPLNELALVDNLQEALFQIRDEKEAESQLAVPCLLKVELDEKLAGGGEGGPGGGEELPVRRLWYPAASGCAWKCRETDALRSSRSSR